MSRKFVDLKILDRKLIRFIAGDSILTDFHNSGEPLETSKQHKDGI